jgi:hypothetical protein
MTEAQTSEVNAECAPVSRINNTIPIKLLKPRPLLEYTCNSGDRLLLEYVVAAVGTEVSAGMLLHHYISET